MTSLHIALQDGFKDDSVEIAVDGKKVYDKAAVTTNLVISLADSVDVDVTDARASVKINVRSRRIAGDISVQPAETPYLAISIEPDGKLEVTPFKEPFRYM